MAERLCPVWVAHLLANPIRKLIQNPRKILGPHVTNGMTVLDIGCAMGFFSLPLAEMVGEEGRLICVDVQQKMIDKLIQRANIAGISGRIETHLGRQNSLGLTNLKERIDFALAFAVVHEVSDPANFFSEVYEALKPRGKFMVSEPKGHVSESGFQKTVSLAEQQGFTLVQRFQDFSGRTVLFEKKTD
jgi:2-polyprenyl-3-methyl-5-hydroxy-6-metoxy-1,4-benzoquinol methylase